MRTGTLTVTGRHSATVAVQTGGGQETNPAWISQISNPDFARAIEESIVENALFSQVVSVDGADYVLNATIFRLDQPAIGFNMEVGIEVLWSLTAKGGKTPLWQKSIHTRASKGVGDAFAAVKRVRITTEAAAQENIAQALRELSQLKLK